MKCANKVVDNATLKAARMFDKSRNQSPHDGMSDENTCQLCCFKRESESYIVCCVRMNDMSNTMSNTLENIW